MLNKFIEISLVKFSVKYLDEALYMWLCMRF